MCAGVIKSFFQKKKQDAKFKLAGKGHSLTESSSSSSKQYQNPSSSVSHPRERSEAAETAGAAALSRIQSQQQAAAPNWSQTYLKARIKREMESEKQKQQETQVQQSNEEKFSGVYFTCPLLGPEVLSWDEMTARITEFLYDNLQQDEALTACLIIHTCNKNKSKVTACVEILYKYLNNILENKEDEKYRKIRVNNKVYQDKVANMKGTSEFLSGAGFEKKMLEHQGNEEEFWVFPQEKLEDNILQELLDSLVSAEPILPQLDRALKVFNPEQAARHLDIPQSFYNLSLEEAKRLQSQRSEEVERSLQLRTKAMRERDEIKQAERFRFCYIRIKFPNCFVLQGTFFSNEKFENVEEFIKENLYNSEWKYSLSLAEVDLKDSSKTLSELGLPPASVLRLEFLPDQLIKNRYLKDDVMALLQPL